MSLHFEFLSWFGSPMGPPPTLNDRRSVAVKTKISNGMIATAMAALAIAPMAASASDGVLEINQTCATQTGCFPGDSAGFPVTL